MPYLKSATLINTLGYRGDTRPPEEIFPNGFYNRQHPETQWLKVLNGGSQDIEADDYENLNLQVESAKTDHLTPQQFDLLSDQSLTDCEPLAPPKLEYRLWLKSDPKIFMIIKLKTVAGIRADLWTHYAQNLPLYRNQQKDIAPQTAVCLTVQGPHVASYFPIGGCTQAGGEWIWIYAVTLGAAYTTYTYQQKAKSSLAKAKEVAVEHVSASDVMCAVRCWRKGKYPNMDFLLAPRVCWNPRAGGQRLLWKDTVVGAFHKYQGMTSTCADCTVTESVQDPQKLFSEPTYAYWQWQKK